MVINSKTENVVDRVMEITGAQGFENFYIVMHLLNGTNKLGTCSL